MDILRIFMHQNEANQVEDFHSEELVMMNPSRNHLTFKILENKLLKIENINFIKTEEY